MKKENNVFFLPTRKGSQRVPYKNTRSFAGFQGGLLENKLLQLLDSIEIDEIILSTNDEECIRIAEPFRRRTEKIKIIPRPESLCLDSTNLQDLIAYVPTITDADNIIWGHVTTPIANGIVYDDAIRSYYSNLNKGYDSLISVMEFRNFLFNSKGRLINNTTNLPWPRTQDLAPLYEINHVLFIANREIYIKENNRVGSHPYMYVMNKIQSLDVDWEEDFLIAEEMYKRLYS